MTFSSWPCSIMTKRGNTAIQQNTCILKSCNASVKLLGHAWILRTADVQPNQQTACRTVCCNACANMNALCIITLHVIPAVESCRCSETMSQGEKAECNIPGDHSQRFELLEGGPCKWNTAPHLLRALPCVLAAWSIGNRAVMSDMRTPCSFQYTKANSQASTAHVRIKAAVATVRRGPNPANPQGTLDLNAYAFPIMAVEISQLY